MDLYVIAVLFDVLAKTGEMFVALFR